MKVPVEEYKFKNMDSFVNMKIMLSLEKNPADKALKKLSSRVENRRSNM